MFKFKHNSTNGLANSVFSTTEHLSLTEKDALFTKFTNEHVPSEPGNITPHFWYKKVIDDKGRPDLIAISLLSEIFALYRFANSYALCSSFPKNSCDEPVLIGKTLRTSYEHFTNKFGFAKEKTRRGLVRLEELKIITRGVCNILLENGGRCNKLMITLDQDFFLSCFRNPDNDIRGRKKSPPPAQKTKSEFGASNNGKSTAESSDGNKFQSIQISYHHISNKNNIKKDRSMNSASSEAKSGSNFIKNDLDLKQDSLEKVIEENPSAPADLIATSENLSKSKSLFSRVIPSFFLKPKKLADFYPLSQEDCIELQNKSGREFSLNAMNEILLNMSKRRTNPFFHSKKGFLSYMTKAFAYEKRDAVKINNENFKIKANLSSEERRAEEAEKYLEEIEYSPQVSTEWHFKKKLACVLEKNKAYSLLKAYKSIAIEGSVAKLNLYKAVELTQNDIGIVLAQIKATHERYEDGRCARIDKVEFIHPKTNLQALPCNEGSELPDSLWGSIRRQLISIYGQAVDGHWFSKLEAKIDEDKRTIELKASSGFLKDWIERNYEQSINQVAATMRVNIKIFV